MRTLIIGKGGFLDEGGNNVTNYEYDLVTEQNGNVAGIKVNNKWGIIDTQGNIILEPIYEINSTMPKFIGQYYEYETGINVPKYSKDIPKENR